MNYYVADGDQQRGPFTLEELWRVEFGPDTLVWRDGMADWQRADSLADLRVVLAGKTPDTHAPTIPPPPPPAPDGPAEFDIKIPTDVRPVEKITVYPGADPAQQYPGATGIQYASAGGFGYGGADQVPSGAAITSMVLGIIALFVSFFAFCFMWVFSGPLAIAAIVTGHIARGQARRGIAGGASLALAGLICGYCALALTAIFMLGFFGLLLGRA